MIPRLDLQLLENLQAVEMVEASHLQRESADGRMIHRRQEDVSVYGAPFILLYASVGSQDILRQPFTPALTEGENC